LPGGSNRRGAVSAAAASLAIGFGGALLLAETALAGCTPQAGDNVTATCTGTTANQGGGAAGTSAGSNGYGTGVETGVTVSVDIGASVSGTGDPIASAGISIENGAVNTSNGATVTGQRFGIHAGTATVTNNAGATVSGITAIETVSSGASSVFNAGTINGTLLAVVFRGSSSTLTLAAGSVINGEVLGGGGTLQLGGSAAASFDVHGLDVQYHGFSAFNKVDGSVWTLTGTTRASLARSTSMPGRFECRAI